MKRKKLILTSIFLLLSTSASAQERTNESSNSKLLATVYENCYGQEQELVKFSMLLLGEWINRYYQGTKVGAGVKEGCYLIVKANPLDDAVMAREFNLLSNIVKTKHAIAINETVSIDYVDTSTLTPLMIKPATVMFNKVTIKGSPINRHTQAIQFDDECAQSVLIPTQNMTQEYYNPLTISIDSRNINGQKLVINDTAIADLIECFDTLSRVLLIIEGEIQITVPANDIAAQNTDPNQEPNMEVRIGTSIIDENGKTINQFALSASPKIKFLTD